MATENPYKAVPVRSRVLALPFPPGSGENGPVSQSSSDLLTR